MRRDVARPRDPLGKVARRDDARLRDVDPPAEIPRRDAARPRDVDPPDSAVRVGLRWATPPATSPSSSRVDDERPSTPRPPWRKGSFRPVEIGRAHV